MLSYGEMASSGRVAGGTPVYGESHHPAPEEREQVRQFILFLADRSALVSVSPHRHPDWIVASAVRIRDELYRVLGVLPRDALAVPSLRMMRAECEKMAMYSDGGYRERRRGLFGLGKSRPPLFWMAVGNLRSVFGLQIATLCVLYGIDLDGPITAILPRG